jgi:hypothetical protein
MNRFAKRWVLGQKLGIRHVAMGYGVGMVRNSLENIAMSTLLPRVMLPLKSITGKSVTLGSLRGEAHHNSRVRALGRRAAARSTTRSQWY